MNLEELKLKEAKALATNGTVHEGPEWAEFTHALGLVFPAIVAKLKAAQRLRDAIAAQHCNGACVGNGKSILVRNALAAFDKEQQ